MAEVEDLAETIGYYSEKILEKKVQDPKHRFLPAYHFQRSVLHEKQGNFESSLADAYVAKNLRPTFWKYNHQLLKMLIKLENIQKAEKLAIEWKNDEFFFDLIKDLEKLMKKKMPSTRRKTRKSSSFTPTESSDIVISDDFNNGNSTRASNDNQNQPLINRDVTRDVENSSSSNEKPSWWKTFCCIC